MTKEEAVALLERYSNYDGMGIPNLAGCKEAMRVAVDALKKACPELAESEDERIRKVIHKLMLGMREEIFTSQDEIVTKEKVLAYLEKQKDLDKMIVVSPEVWDNAISDAYENGKKDSEKQKEQKPWKVGANAYFTPEQKPVEFTHHEIGESLEDAVTHQMEDDSDVDDFVRRGIDDIALKYAELGAKWQKEQKPINLHDKIEELCSKYPINKYSMSDEELSVYHQGIHLGATKIAEYLNEQKSVEWGEEDEDMRDTIIRDLKHLGGDMVNVSPAYKAEIDWLKSLSIRCSK